MFLGTLILGTDSPVVISSDFSLELDGRLFSFSSGECVTVASCLKNELSDSVVFFIKQDYLATIHA
jgi:hypothetical protein